MGFDFPALDATGLGRFQALRSVATERVADRFGTAHAEDYAPYGARGREACRQDIAYHLEFLAPVLEFGIVQPMVDYLRWLEGVLDSRGIPADHLAVSLEWLAQYYAEAMPGPYGEAVAGALRMAVARLLDPRGAPAPADASMPRAWPECGAFTTALLEGDRHAAAAVFERALDANASLVDVALHLVQPALYAIGRNWQANQASVAQEHLATAIAQSLLTEGLLRSKSPAWNGRKVLLACVQDNHHAVGLQMVADAFQLAGWQVQYLGANVPTSALIAQVRKYEPDVLGLSVSFAHQLRGVRDVLTPLPDLGPRPAVIVGGLAINQFDQLADHLGADAWGRDAAEAVSRAAKLVPMAGRA